MLSASLLKFCSGWQKNLIWDTGLAIKGDSTGKECHYNVKRPSYKLKAGNATTKQLFGLKEDTGSNIPLSPYTLDYHQYFKILKEKPIKFIAYKILYVVWYKVYKT